MARTRSILGERLSYLVRISWFELSKTKTVVKLRARFASFEALSPKNHQRNPSKDRSRGDNKSQSELFAEKQNTTTRRDHGHAKLHSRRLRCSKASHRRVPDRIANSRCQSA